jgi:hypothetical protein
VKIGKKPENASFLALQASHRFRIGKKLPLLPRPVFPVEV